jgi:hypothetical protein
MAVRITHIRLTGSTTHENISDFQWVQEDGSSRGTTRKANMVRWIDVEGGRAYVTSARGNATVGVVKPQGSTPYLRTYADGVWNNNLLALPRF